MKRSNLDMTSGQPLSLLVRFAMPLMLGAFFQQMYSFVDTAIVGRFISVDALSAVGVTGSLAMVVLGFTMGTTAGFTILVSQSVGAQSRENIDRYFWNGLSICVTMGLMISLIVTPLVRPLLTWMNTPAQLLDMAVEYLTVIVLGALPSVLYNYFAGILRAFGDSKRPFYFLLISSFCNVLLDLALILLTPLGVAGAAVATVLSQILSAILCIWWLFGKMNAIGPRQKADAATVRRLLGVGLPLGMESCVTSLGFLFLQSSINALGAVAAAAQVCGERIRHIATIPCDALSTAVNTYVGQNYGARRIDRIKTGIKGALGIQLVVCVATWAILLVADGPLVYLLLGQTDSPEALGAIQYLNIMSALFLLQGTMKVMRSIPQGMGRSMLAFGAGAMEILGRVVGGALAVRLGSFVMICLSNPMAWGFALVYCACVGTWLLRSEERKLAAVSGR